MITKEIAQEECELFGRVRTKVNDLVEKHIDDLPDRMIEGMVVVTFPDYFQLRSGDTEYKVTWYTNMFNHITRLCWVSTTLISALEQMDHFLDETHLHPEWFRTK